MKVIWVEKMGLTDVLYFMVRSRFSRIRVNYDKFRVEPLAAKLIRAVTRPGLSGVFFSAELSLHKVDANGLALCYLADKELYICIEDFISGHIPNETKRFKNMLRSYLAGCLNDKFLFITMVISEISSGKPGADESNIVCLSGSPLNYLVSRYYNGRDFVITKSINPARNLFFYLKPCGYMVFVLWNKLRNFKVRNSISDIRPAIWAEYYPSHVHNFWMDTINADGFDIVAYLDRSDTPIMKEATDEIEKKGIKWIDAGLPSLIRMSSLSISSYLKMAGRIVSIPFSRPAWLGTFRFEYRFLSSVYESVFRRYKVKILIQHQEASWRQEAQAVAIERAGGIMVGYHWSVYTSYLLPTHFYPQHVYFVWGKYMSELLRKKDSACRYVLPSGMWELPESKTPARKEIFAENIKFIISVFDSSVGYNFYQSPGSLSEFYLRILKIVENNPGIGCIIKSKQPLDQSLPSIPSGREILDKIETLKSRGRLSVFDYSVSPLVAASCSDLCVGYGINSACTIVAAIGNCAAINWDCAGLKKHPFYRYPECKVIYENLDEIEDAILRAERGDKSVGDYGSLKKLVNYYEDLSAVRRITGFMETYMKARSEEAGDPERSLEFAAKKYLDDNNIGEDYYQVEDIWQEE